MKVTKKELVNLVIETWNRKKEENKKTLDESKLKETIKQMVVEKLGEMDFSNEPRMDQPMEEPGLIEDDFGFAAGMNKAIKGRLSLKNCQEMQSLLWKAVTNELTEPDKEKLKKYWLQIFDNAIEQKFIGKVWYPFGEEEIESEDEIVEPTEDGIETEMPEEIIDEPEEAEEEIDEPDKDKK